MTPETRTRHEPPAPIKPIKITIERRPDGGFLVDLPWDDPIAVLGCLEMTKMLMASRMAPKPTPVPKSNIVLPQPVGG